MTTRRLPTVFAVLLVAFASVACGNDDGDKNYEGTYQVIQHTRNNAGCESSGGAVDSGDPFFRLEERNGDLAYIACSSATECEEFANDTRTLERQEGDVWIKQIASADDDGNTCELQLVERRAEPAQNGIRLSREKLAKLYQMQDFECTEDAVEPRRDELECTETETIIAVPAE